MKDTGTCGDGNSPDGGMPASPSGSAWLLQVPAGDLSEIKGVRGPAAIKCEESVLASYVYVDFAGTDIGGDIQEAKIALKTSLKAVPPDWAHCISL